MQQTSSRKAQGASLTDQTIQDILDLLQRETDLRLSSHVVARCVHEAESAARNSYAPYIKPNFGSGVTILGSNGGTASGSRVENACTNLTLSASSVAAWRSVFLGLKSPQLIVQWRSGEGYQGMEPTIFQGLSGDHLSGFAPNAIGIEIDPGASARLVQCPRSSQGLPAWKTPEFSAQDAPSAERIFGRIRQKSGDHLEEKEVIRLREAALDAATPCGACRQALFEFGPKATCISFNLGRTIKVRDMNELLPRAFGPSAMIS